MKEGEFKEQGWVDIHLASTEISVAPGSSTIVPVMLTNRGSDKDVLTLAVDGIPAEWVSIPSAFIPLSAGEQREVALTIHPPRSTQSDAGRHPIRIQAKSQAAPGRMAEAACTLTLATFIEFSSELHPQRLEAGQPGRVTVENRGNVQEAFALTWQSPSDELTFDPGPTQELQVPAGESGVAEFRASLRRRPLFGGEKSYSFTTRVRSAQGAIQNLSGVIVGRGLIPTWVVVGLLVVALACACSAGGAAIGGWQLLAPGATEPTALPPQPQPTGEQPAPTQAPPTEAPPPEKPTAPPPQERPTDDAGGGKPPEEAPAPICPPVALGLVLVPLGMMYKWGRRR